LLNVNKAQVSVASVGMAVSNKISKWLDVNCYRPEETGCAGGKSAYAV